VLIKISFYCLNIYKESQVSLYKILFTNLKKQAKIANYKQVGYKRISERCSKETFKFKSRTMIPCFDSIFLELTVP